MNIYIYIFFAISQILLLPCLFQRLGTRTAMDTDPHESFKDQLPFEEYLLHGQELGKRRKFLDAISKETEESLSVCFEKIKKGIVTLVGVPFYHSKEVLRTPATLVGSTGGATESFHPEPNHARVFFVVFLVVRCLGENQRTIRPRHQLQEH